MTIAKQLVPQPSSPKADTSDNAHADSKSQAESMCFHCLEALPKFSNIHALLDGQNRAFCCHGCKAAAEFIDGRGLADFYQHRQRSCASDQFGMVAKSDLPAGQEQNNAWRFLDSQSSATDYLIHNEDGSRELQLLVHGLYCSSCSWLIEKAIHKLDPAIEVRIDLDAKRVHLCVAAESKVLISDLFSLLAHLGYQPSPLTLAASHQQLENLAAAENRQFIKRIVVAGFGMMQVMTYAVALYLGDAQGMDTDIQYFLTLVSMLVATAVVFYSGKPFFANALNDLRNRHFGMDVPIALAIAGAYFPSVYNTLMKTGEHVYFDSAVMFVFFLLIGRFVEMRARHRLTAAPDAIAKLLPSVIDVERQHDNQVSKLSIRVQDVQVGDQLSLRAGSITPFDARVNGGIASVDESLITGEAAGVEKGAGDQLLAGSRVASGLVSVEASKLWADSSIVKIERMLKKTDGLHAHGNAPLQRFSRVFVVAVLLLTLCVGIFWWFYQSERALEVVLAMLIASCPCAFALAAPVSVTAASNALKRSGILLSNAKALRLLPRISLWSFDKTGTLTKGKTSISRVEAYTDMRAENCLELMASIQGNSRHVLAGAFTNIETDLVASDVREVPGCGLHANVNGTPYYLGKRKWVAEQVQQDDVENIELPTRPHESEIALATDLGLIASVCIRDELRDGAAKLVQDLNQQRKEILILSGDRQSAVDAISEQLSVERAYGDLLPEQKLARLQAEQLSGHTVAMVGDGMNDAPVLAQADLSIVFASGSELSQSQADVVLLSGRLDSLNTLQRIARLSERVTQQNLVWALAYNALVLPLAASGNLTPWIAAIGMSLSSLLVVLNALRITNNNQE